MGTTIRREPITTSIPAAPDYKFLNITNFGGIEKSSNPFVVNSNTASDCLNVYVDEDNALSTRPRLQHQTNFVKDIMEKFPITENFEIIGVYDLHDGYLVHGVEADEYYMFKHINNTVSQITGEYIPRKKCKIFEHTDTIYVLDGYKYRNIKNNTISEVEGYVPLVVVGKNKRTKTIAADKSETYTIDYGGTVLESPNILTDKCRESYFWDGTWDISDIGDVYKILPTHEHTQEWDGNTEFLSNDLNGVFKYIPNYSTDNFSNTEYVLIRTKDASTNRYVPAIGVLDANVNKLSRIIKLPEALKLPDVAKTVSCDCTDDASKIVVRYEVALQDYGDVRYGGVFLYDTETEKWSDLDEDYQPYLMKYSTTGHKAIAMSADGGVIVTYGSGTFVGDDCYLMVYTYETDLKKYKRKIITLNSKIDISSDYFKMGIVGVDVSKDGSTVMCYLKTGKMFTNEIDDDLVVENSNGVDFFNRIVYAKTTSITNDIEVNIATMDQFDKGYFVITTPYTDSDTDKKCGFYNVALSPDGTQLYTTFKTTKDPLLYRNIFDVYKDDENNIHYPEYMSLPVMVKISNIAVPMQYVYAPHFTENKLFVVYDFNGVYETGYFILDNTYRFIPNYIELSKFFPGKTNQYATNSSYFITTWTDTQARNLKFIKTDINFDSAEPTIEVTRTLKEAGFEIDSAVITNFNKADIVTKFDNNTWFASSNNNYIYHTENNDPTYIPIIGYNDLGHSHEPITGLSIINDDVLAAYKRNRIYIITPTIIGDNAYHTYAYTETKNVIGNDVINAPILTILTEMPVIVSYNGIYALNQLENVQSSDRITALISESMNPKWLKERKEDVDGCITLNRLYWTYFILPHKKVSNGIEKDNDYTKIYLLDNRTGMWFYWELPIYVISAMIKDNKTHFITSSGELYSLETTDIINKFNKDLTEYYDDLKKPSLIPWYWVSQILSLNTINYSKRLVDTTFVLTDTDSSDSYALNYKFKAFRKNKNAETTELTLTNDIEYVESITKRTMIPRFNFLQFTLSNTEDDEKLNNNKLRLVGLGLKYVLLGGLY